MPAVNAIALMEIDPFTRLDRLLCEERAAVLDHPVYRRVHDLSSLRVLMSSHVFAVWDFMSLLKALQRHLTCVDVPWLPPADPTFARFVNEIVLGEETDEVLPGRFMSHFDLYLAAMAEIGADTRPIRRLLQALRAGQTAEVTIKELPIPETTRQFVLSTLSMAQHGTVHEIAAAFLLGREELVPEMFRRLLRTIEADLGRACPSFRLYLERHVALDEQEHGPRARRLLQGLCGGDAVLWEQALGSARVALRARKRLWDGVVDQISASVS